jgi:hypothetical protein
MGDGSVEILSQLSLGTMHWVERAKKLFFLLDPILHLPSSISLEKVLYLGKPQDRTFRSHLPSPILQKIYAAKTNR